MYLHINGKVTMEKFNDLFCFLNQLSLSISRFRSRYEAHVAVTKALNYGMITKLLSSIFKLKLKKIILDWTYEYITEDHLMKSI